MKRKIWTFILLMVCALGIWRIAERTLRTHISYSPISSRERLGSSKTVARAIFRSVPIVAFGFGMYFLFLREKR